MCSPTLQSRSICSLIPRLLFGNKTYARTAHAPTTNAPLIGPCVSQQTAGRELVQVTFSVLHLTHFLFHWACFSEHVSKSYVSALLKIGRNSHFLHCVLIATSRALAILQRSFELAITTFLSITLTDQLYFMNVIPLHDGITVSNM